MGLSWDLVSALINNEYFSVLDKESVTKDRKRPRKLLQKVLECNIEEVSVAQTKKRVGPALRLQSRGFCAKSSPELNQHCVCPQGDKASQWRCCRGQSCNPQNSGIFKKTKKTNHHVQTAALHSVIGGRYA